MPIVVHKEDEPLLEAVMRGDMEEMKDILRGGDGDIFRDVNANGDTALHLACRFGRLDFVKYFLKSASSDRARAALNNRANVRGQIPLHYAAMYGMEDLVEYVVKDLLNDEEDFGDPREARDQSGRRPIDAALGNGHAQCAAILRDPQQAKLDAERREAAQRLAEANERLHFASRHGDLEWVRELLDKHGAELNFLDEATGNTPLLTAAENQKADLARFLVTRGADPHFKNAKKICAAHHDTSLVWFQAQHLEAVRVKEEEEKKRKSRYHTRHSD